MRTREFNTSYLMGRANTDNLSNIFALRVPICSIRLYYSPRQLMQGYSKADYTDLDIYIGMTGQLTRHLE